MRQQIRRRPKWKINFVNVILSILLAIFLISSSYLLVSFFSYKGLNIPDLGVGKYSWNGNGEVVFLTADISKNGKLNNIKLVSVDSKNGVNYVSLPANIAVGELTLGSYYAIESENKSNLAVQSLLNNLKEITGNQIDGYIFQKEGQSVEGLNLSDLTMNKLSTTSVFLEFPVIVNNLNNNIFTNFDINSLLNISSYLSSSKKTLLNTTSDFSIQSGGDALVSQNFNKDVSSMFLDSSLESEHARISVYNASGKRGIADEVAGFIVNQGGVIDITRDDQIQPGAYIYCATPQSFPYTINKLEKEYNAKLISKQNSITSDITLVLGTDSVKSL